MTRHYSALRLTIAMCSYISTAFPHTKLRAAESVSFLRDVKPILARRCFSCHGPSKQEGGLRLDVSDRALTELDSGAHAIVPGDLDQSELIERVTAANESERMPPSGKPLADTEIQSLKHWISA